VSQAEHTAESHTTAQNVSDDVVAAIEAKREALERLAKSDYSVAEHAETLLELADSHN